MSDHDGLNWLRLAAICAGTACVAHAGQPSSITLRGVVRDFLPHNVNGGHPDFERYNSGHRTGLVERRLGEDGKPVLAVNTAGDPTSGGETATAITSPESFHSWYRDVPGLNLSMPCEIQLEWQEATETYVFSASDNADTPEIEGFFPADGELFGNVPVNNYGHNYHFTFELHTQFVYDASEETVFTFRGDDDVWVYINGELVIDLGGTHGPVSGSVDLSTLGLEDGRTYTLDFFFAERHTVGSNFRMETTFPIRTIGAFPTTGLFD